jgi:hypothetical protein
MSESSWIKRYGEGIVIGLLGSAVWAVVAYLFHEGSPWARPMFYGLVAASVPLTVYFGFVIARRIPKQKVVPTTENIESCVRAWLDNHKVTIKLDPHHDYYFRYRLTLDSGCYLTVYRSQVEYQEYVQIVCNLGTSVDEQKLLEQFSDREKAQLMFDIRLELARAKVGYGGLVYPPENFHLFQRVPIYPTLNEFVFMSMIGNVEAARNLVSLVFLKLKSDKEFTALPSTSDSLKLKSAI